MGPTNTNSMNTYFVFAMNIRIMGPTGAGKSSFIEALSGSKELGISKNQLEGFTQEARAYRFQNVTVEAIEDYENGEHYTTTYPVAIFDTPGFADRKMSEMDVVQKVKKCMFESSVSSLLHAVAYFVPITDIRLSGSRRRPMDTFKAMTGTRGAQRVTIITTMWNTIFKEETINKALERYEDLKKGPWKPVLDQGGSIIKLMDNTQECALEALKTILEGTDNDHYFPFSEYRFGPKTPFLPNMRFDLEGRLDSLCSEERRLREEITQAEVDGEDELAMVLMQNLEVIVPNIERFTQQLQELAKVEDEEDEGSWDGEDEGSWDGEGEYEDGKPKGMRKNLVRKWRDVKWWGKEKLLRMRRRM
ncbi:hypothetical protein CVT24_001232 [Panaeolus cyanescens]|uniref:G domain-containing protein n=1 Tax=Panaeolus cyanescens TaxID=181874 RepID=A0A409YYW9_9AGAR|nr:hypothetical protein CVT24_001232 [Panaeolus cyanescens]